jgi:hypothetical protein
MRQLTMKNVLLFSVLSLSLTATALGGEWSCDSAPCPVDIDWQWFAPVQVDCACPDRKAREGYFLTSERMHLWLMRPDRAAIGVDGPPVVAWLPNSVNYLFTDLGTATLGNGLNSNNAGTNGSLSFLFPLVGGGAFGLQFNGIDDGYSEVADGWGNRVEFGRINDGCGWMATIIYDANVHHTDFYGFDDKRLDQLGAGQGLNGRDGIPDPDGNGPLLPTNPVAAVPGTQAILSIDGLLAVPVIFNDPFGLLLGYTDFNFNQLADPLFNPGMITDLAEDTNGDGVVNELDLVRIAVIFDDMEVRNNTRMNGLELTAVRRKRRLQSGFDIEGQLGVRFLSFDDRFQVLARGGALADSDWDNRCKNRLVGPSVGLRASRQKRRWITTVSAKFLAGANFLSIRQRGQLGSHLTIGAPGVPLALGGNAFFHRLGDERFSPVGEFKYEAAFQLTRHANVRAGWTGTIIGNVARASNTVIYDLPQLGIRNGHEDVFSHMLTLGWEINR